jgi:hypothetical protein
LFVIVVVVDDDDDYWTTITYLVADEICCFSICIRLSDIHAAPGEDGKEENGNH